MGRPGLNETRESFATRRDLPPWSRLVAILILWILLFPLAVFVAPPATILLALAVLDMASSNMTGRAVRHCFRA
jgi:hypothetical protein